VISEKQRAALSGVRGCEHPLGVGSVQAEGAKIINGIKREGGNTTTNSQKKKACQRKETEKGINL